MTDPDRLADQLAERLTADLDDRLADADRALAAGFPGERPRRQPVHTAYVPADAYDADVVPRWGAAAVAAVEAQSADFAALVGDESVLGRVRAKLTTEPIEDLRVDFEDGYVGHDGADEDEHVRLAAHALAESQQAGAAAPFCGIRVKSLEAPTRARGVRTLTSFVATYVGAGGSLDGFVVTLPKVTSVDQVAALVHALGVLEAELGLARRSLAFEVQVETPQSILGPDGTALVARMIHAGGGRLTALHYGTYDYSAFCGIAAEQQSLEHPVADHAKLVMQAAAAGTGVRLSDGSTNVLPVGEAAAVLAAWENHHRLVRRSLDRGYYQGWDLHPAQLPTRYAATYGFYRQGLPRALDRLQAYRAVRDEMVVPEGSTPTTSSPTAGIADEPATARALADFVLRGLDCGAVDADEVAAGTGLDEVALRALARR